MNSFARRAAASMAGLVVASALVTGCSSGPEEKDAAGAAEPGAPAAAAETPGERPSPVAAGAKALSVGQTGAFTAVDGEDDSKKTKMQVTVKSVKYATPADVGTTNEPEGQFVVLTLTIKNVGDKPGAFRPYGMMQWEDAETAAQDATTLETVEGQQVDAVYKPGQSATGGVVLDVVRRGGTVSYHDGIGSDPSFTVKMPK
ncbi:DUF4352 domain-containing protein [Streptomyces sp. NPDC051907]|uniref:DUF4352 domain-containing protein n=1 Tax=Streptomyces sp. NPDC051907 TaxID=3155284 RepID=UPI00343CC377